MHKTKTNFTKLSVTRKNSAKSRNTRANKTAKFHEKDTVRRAKSFKGTVHP